MISSISLLAIFLIIYMNPGFPGPARDDCFPLLQQFNSLAEFRRASALENLRKEGISKKYGNSRRHFSRMKVREKNLNIAQKKHGVNR